jgi:transcriptional regulator with XRE-family HTH domain
MGLRGQYKPRKYEVGERLLVLRTHARLTQAKLAELIGVSRRSVQSWETGATCPQADNLQQLIRVFLIRGALTQGQEHEEAVALWQQVGQDGGRRLARFDETWFADLLVAYHQGDNPVTVSEPLSLTSSTNLSAP